MRKAAKHTSCVPVACLAFLLSTNLCYANYTILQIGSLSQVSPAQGHALNNHGQVAGIQYFDIVQNGISYEAYLFDPTNGYISLEKLVGVDQHHAFDISDSGLVTGYVDSFQSPNIAAFWDTKGKVHILPSPDDGNTISYSVNSKGQILGAYETGSILWEPDGSFKTLPLEGGIGRNFYSLSDIGTVTGFTTRPDFDANTYYYLPLTGTIEGVRQLPTGDKPYGWAGGISSDGRFIAGYVSDIFYFGESISYQPVIWDNEVLRKLELPEGYTTGAPTRINIHGEAIGVVSRLGEGFVPVIWDKDGNVHFLRDLLPDDANWSLRVANDINNLGQIVGSGFNFETGLNRGFLLTPIPEPSFCGVMLGVGIGCGLRRRQ